MTKKSKPALPNINVGCGEFPAEGYVNVDITSKGGPTPDVEASVLDLPFTAGSAQKIFAGHVLEHLHMEDVPTALSELKRVLSKNGTLLVVGPDADRARNNFPEALDGIIHGDNRWSGDAHHWESTEEVTERLLQDSGWNTRVIPIESSELDVWPVTSRIGWQFAIFATKA